MKQILSARQWNNYRSGQEALIAASTGSHLPDGISGIDHEPQFEDQEFSTGVRTLHFDNDGQRLHTSK